MKGTYYVYVLQDTSKPLLKSDPFGLKYTPFYVGKGTRNRSKVHVHNAEKYKSSHNPKLLKEILDIRRRGGEVEVTHIFSSDDEILVYQKESEAILRYGLRYKGGILVNAGTGKAGGWGGELNPTFARMEAGTHNFQIDNPQLLNPKLLKLTKLIKNANGDVDIVKEKWVEITGYASVKALKVGILRVLSREGIPYTLNKNKLTPKQGRK